MRMVSGDDEPPGVPDVPAHLGEPSVRCGEDGWHPLPRGIQRRTPGLRGEVSGQRLAQRCRELVTRSGAPRMDPEYARNKTGRTTPSRSASP